MEGKRAQTHECKQAKSEKEAQLSKTLVCIEIEQGMDDDEPRRRGVEKFGNVHSDRIVSLAPAMIRADGLHLSSDNAVVQGPTALTLCLRSSLPNSPGYCHRDCLDGG